MVINNLISSHSEPNLEGIDFMTMVNVHVYWLPEIAMIILLWSKFLISLVLAHMKEA